MNSKLVLNISFGISFLATMGSLFFSEVMKYEPCKLCWEQRILMYPIALISLVSLLTENYRNHVLILIMSVIGFGISSYHYALQKIPSLSDSATSCGLVPCNGEYINLLGFITIPFLAGTGFLLLVVVNLIFIIKSKKENA